MNRLLEVGPSSGEHNTTKIQETYVLPSRERARAHNGWGWGGREGEWGGVAGRPEGSQKTKEHNIQKYQITTRSSGGIAASRESRGSKIMHSIRGLFAWTVLVVCLAVADIAYTVSGFFFVRIN